MRNYYLIKVWKNNKLLFFIFLFFMLGQFFFSYKAVETMPFFNYGMYSQVCRPQIHYSTIGLYTLEGHRINLFESNFSPTFMSYQLSYYTQLIEQGSVDFTKKTIANRFGSNSRLSNYLNQYLTTTQTQLYTAPAFMGKKIKNDNFFIFKENYEWVNNNFKLVSQKKIN